MNFYFSSNQFPQLQAFDFRSRQQIITLATGKLSPLAKFVLNLLKMAILIPPFFMLANVQSWYFLLPLVFVLVGYFIVLRPLSLMFIHKHLEKAINQFKRDQGIV